MNLRLTGELEQLINRHVDSGRYHSASEVVRDALRLLADRDELLELQKKDLQRRIAEGLDSIERGAGLDGHAFFAQLEREEQARSKSCRGSKQS